MTEFEVDEEYIEEVNTSYDQDKEIGSTPSAYFAYSQPMDAKNNGLEKFKSRDQQQWYYATGQDYLDDEPHEARKVEGEKLNKDGTGVRRAKRGVNPKNTPAKVLEFVYVSKSECEICKQYDGQIFATDSPNRPIIPRLESQGKKGTRPYTHPNCKCKWVRPFSKTGLKNFGQTRGGESEANELRKSTLDAIKKEYGEISFDELNKNEQLDVVISSLLKKLSDESFDPTSLPIASMLKMTYDAIEPTLALRLARMSHNDSNEVREFIDVVVGESLSSERKHKIVLEHNLDFTFENLMNLTVNALIENLNEEKEIGMDVEMEFTDDEEKAKDTVEDHLEEDPEHYSRLKSVFEHDVWDEKTNTLVDPTLLEDKKESDEGEFGFTDNEWDNFPEEVKNELSTKVFKKESFVYDYEQSWKNATLKQERLHLLLEADKTIDNNLIAELIDKNWEDLPEEWQQKIKSAGVIPTYESKIHEEFQEQDHPRDEDGKFTDKTEIYTEEDEIKRLDKQNNELAGILSRMNANKIEMLKIDIRLEQKRLEDIENNIHPDEFYELYNERVKAQLLSHSKRKLESKKQELKELTGESKASEDLNNPYGLHTSAQVNNFDHEGNGYKCKICDKYLPEDTSSGEFDDHLDTHNLLDDLTRNPYEATEGGRGSGRKGHQKWMLGAEADPEECPNCMILTEKKNGNCQICGNSY